MPDPWHCRGTPIELTVRDELCEVSTPVRNVCRAKFESVSRAIRDGGTVEFGRDDAVAQATLMEALRDSAKAGMPVPVGGVTVEEMKR